MRGELFACMWTHKDMGLVRTIARARRLARPRALDQQAARELRATSSFLDWGDSMRHLIGWCPETRQSIDLHLYVDDATLSRIWSKAVRFQCPHCGIKHETTVERLASRLFSHEPTKKPARRQRAARPSWRSQANEGYHAVLEVSG